MASLKSGKEILSSNSDTVQINFEQGLFQTPPSVVIANNENLILYLHEITSNYVIIKTNNPVNYNTEIYYSAVEIED